ncbi:hypothetical protein [Enterococcus wangshanyuanii]|uniref:Restriction endonuclease n=1 Tax=Enterococcus wangshanyuanii TaxID=2005703 RepID=A0ABQ1NH35_9ENTE|nr:hypothetical protein [Enterococcus wangshanyuanii]GGC76280.1 hypothetical protein GCM10011573_02330 [Enterococcus wangshanyuanii]
MKISDKLGLGMSQSELDFVDIDLENDMPLFLDPYFLSIRDDRWSQVAHRTLENYFGFILNLLHEEKQDEARTYFRFNEPEEVCFGWTKKGTKGNGLGKDESKKLFQYIIDSEAVTDGVINTASDIKIFVRNIGHDKLSDLTINVIRKHLIEYTKNQMELLGIKLEKAASGIYWDSKNMSWNNSFEDMLVIEGKPIILVPKAIVCRMDNYFYDYNIYANSFVYNYLAETEIRLGSTLVRERKNGEQYVTKKDLKKEYGFDKKIFLQEFTKNHPEIYDHFKSQAEDRVASVTDIELIEDYSDELYLGIIDSMISKFKTIPTGKSHANDYHNLIIGTMTFLFYPDLINPIKEQPIHDGRKRIDISYDNASRRGFFYTLSNNKKIPCSYVFVECKNYSGEVLNPEFDQLNGRFSVNNGQFGFLVFRGTENEELILDRCRDFYSDMKNLIIPIMDKDFVSLLEKKKNTEYDHPQQEFLNTLARKIMVG